MPLYSGISVVPHTTGFVSTGLSSSRWHAEDKAYKGVSILFPRGATPLTATKCQRRVFSQACAWEATLHVVPANETENILGVDLEKNKS